MVYAPIFLEIHCTIVGNILNVFHFDTNAIVIKIVTLKYNFDDINKITSVEYFISYRGNSTRRFKLSNTENRYRMRLKLTENLKFNSHTDASRQRDISSTPDVVIENRLVQLPLSASIDDSVVNDEDKMLSPTGDDDDDESTEIENVAESR